MGETAATAQVYQFDAQTPDGQAMSGQVTAASIEAAANQLRRLQLSVATLQPAQPKPRRSAPLGADDFLAFNQQLAQLTAGGMPVERSLQLMAAEMSGRRRRAIGAVLSRLQSGVPLPEAFAAERGLFPPLYSKLLTAGIRTNNLPAMLLNLGRHLDTLRRVRAACWRAALYPLMVLAALLVVEVFIWAVVMPELDALSAEMNLQAQSFLVTAPAWMTWVPPVARVVSGGLIAVLAIILLAALVGGIASMFPGGSEALMPVVSRLPLIGGIVRRSLIARWCDGLQLGISAGLDLPESLSLAGDAVATAGLRQDSLALAAVAAGGRPLDSIDRLRLLPAVVPATLQMGIDQSDLHASSLLLAKMYQEQVEQRIQILPQLLAPPLLMFTAFCVGLAVFSAIVSLFSTLRIIMALAGFK